MKDIAIYGAIGIGREIKARIIGKFNEIEGLIWNFIGFFDDGKVIGSFNEYGKILGGIDILNNWNRPLSISFAIGNPHLVKCLSEKINNDNIDFPNLIAHDNIFLDINSLKIGKGNIICPRCSISCNVEIGDFNIFNWNISIGHDAMIGSFNSFMPGVRVSGETIIGEGNLFGANSFIKQQLKIGNNITLSPLSVLLSKPKDDNVYIGNPAKIFKF